MTPVNICVSWADASAGPVAEPKVKNVVMAILRDEMQIPDALNLSARPDDLNASGSTLE
jgi:hypothetical protein